jgi:hypothetical protein
VSKYVIIPIAGEIHVDLPDDFDGDADEAFDWAMDNLPHDFSLDKHLRRLGGGWDFYRHIAQGNVWWAETAAEASVEES